MDYLWVWIVSIAGIGVILERLWTKIIMPIIRAIHATMVFVQAYPILVEISNQFKPNDGESLYDQIRELKHNVNNVATQYDTVVIQLNEAARNIASILEWMKEHED